MFEVTMFAGVTIANTSRGGRLGAKNPKLSTRAWFWAAFV